MKFITYLFTGCMAAASFSSCINRQDIEPNSKTEVITDYETVRPFNTISVNCPAGKIAYVICGGDTVATTTETTTVQVPNSTVVSRASDYTIAYEDYTGIQTVKYSSLYYVLMFEDTPGGDNDYNDVILHIFQRFTTSGSSTLMTINIQPIAMGNTMPMKLGADIYYCDDSDNRVKASRFYFSDNIKSDPRFFGESDTTKMINTTATGASLKCYDTYSSKVLSNTAIDGSGKTYSAINYRADGSGFLPQTVPNGYSVYVNWFIENANGKRLYTVPSLKTGSENWLSDAGYPLGLAVSHIRNATFKENGKDMGGLDWINYPQERVNIETVFPGFKSWIEGKGTVPDFTAPTEGTYIDAIKNYTDSYANSLYSMPNNAKN